MKSLCKLLLSVMLIHSNLFSQPINEFAAKSYLRTGNSDGYISPFIDVVGSSMNSSGFSYLYDSIQKFHIYVGLNVTSAFIPGSMQSFDGVTEEPFSRELTVANAPTVFGSNSALTAVDQTGNAYVFPGGFGINRVNLLFPSLQIGNFFNTNLSFRFLALDFGGDLKSIKLFGGGIQHFISPYWGAKDYFVGVGASYNQIKIGEYLTGNSILAQVNAGQQKGIFNYYGFAAYQKNKYEFFYADAENGDGSVVYEGDQPIRFGLGGGIQLWKFYLHAEGSGFKPVVASVGFGLRFK